MKIVEFKLEGAFSDGIQRGSIGTTFVLTLIFFLTRSQTDLIYLVAQKKRTSKRNVTRDSHESRGIFSRFYPLRQEKIQLEDLRARVQPEEVNIKLDDVNY